MKRNDTLIKKKYLQYLMSTISMSAALYLAILVDSILVGNILGADELAAVNLCNPVIFMSNSIFCILIYGGTTAAAMHIGKQDKAGANEIFTLSMGICFLIQVLYMVLCISSSSQISGVLSQNGSLQNLVASYLIPLSISIPVIGISSGIAGFARLDGFTGLSALIPIVSNIVNLGLDVVFMKYCHMGIAGAGWASVCGYVFGCLFMIPYLKSHKRSLLFVKIGERFKKHMQEILSTGLPTSLTNACSFVRSLVVNMIILSALGSEGIQILTVCLNASALVSIVVQGAGNTILPIAGALYGEKDMKGIKYAFWTSIVVSGAAALLFMLFFQLYPTAIARVCGLREPMILDQLVPAFQMYVLSFLFVTIIYQIESLYQSTGNTTAASVVSVVEGVVFIVPIIFILSQISLHMIWSAFPLAESICLVFIVLYAEIMKRKKHVNGLLLLNFEDDEKLLDVTIENSIGNAVDISKAIIEFCTKNQVEEKQAVKLAAAAEEITVNIAKYAYKKEKQNIDISLRILDKSIVLKVRDDGAIFNPLEAIPKDTDSISGIEFVKKLADCFTYNRVVGFNVVVITINK